MTTNVQIINYGPGRVKVEAVTPEGVSTGRFTIVQPSGISDKMPLYREQQVRITEEPSGGF